MNVVFAIVHLVLVALPITSGLANKKLSSIETIVITYVLIWTDFIIVGNILSFFNALGNSFSFELLTICCSAASYPLLTRIAPFGQIPCLGDKKLGLAILWERFLYLFFVSTGMVVLICNLLIAFSIYPDNPDSVAYRLPRIVFYLSHGSFTHFTDGDLRMMVYPLNGVLLESFIAYHSLQPSVFTLVSCFSWVIVGLATYRLSQLLGVSRLAACGTAWFVCFCPIVLLQATSTNDEIVAAAPLLIASLITFYWLHSHKTSHLVLASIAVGVSFGTKLHWLFFWPLFFSLGLLCWRRRYLTKRLILELMLSFTIVGALSSSFIAYNLLSNGQVMNHTFTDTLSNKPFDIRVAIQTISIYALQLFVNPIADLYIAKDHARSLFYSGLNDMCNRWLLRFVDQRPAYMANGYTFQGIWYSYSSALTETSVYLGLVPLLFIAGLIFVPVTWELSSLFSFLLIVSFWTYFITYAAATKYIESVSTYFAYTAVVAGPGLARLWWPARNQVSNVCRVMLIMLVIITNTIFAVNLLLHNVYRNVHVALRTKLDLHNPGKVDSRIQKEIEQARNVYFVYTHFEIPFYYLMQFNPTAKYSVGRQTLHSDLSLSILSYPAGALWGVTTIPVKVFENPNEGLTYLGLYSDFGGPEYAFASGSRVDQRHPADSGYVIFSLTFDKAEGSWTVTRKDLQTNLERELKFRFEVRSPMERTYSSDWITSSSATFKIEPPFNDLVLNLQVCANVKSRVAAADCRLVDPVPVLGHRD